MKFNTKSMLLAAMLSGASLYVAAQPAAPQHGPGGQHARMDPAKMQEMIAKRQADLKAKLMLAPAQEGAWSQYVAAMQPPADMARRMDLEQRKKMHEEMEKLSTPERIDRMNAMKSQRDTEMARRAEAVKSFYAALNPDQQKVYDTNAMRPGRGGRHGPGHEPKPQNG